MGFTPAFLLFGIYYEPGIAPEVEHLTSEIRIWCWWRWKCYTLLFLPTIAVCFVIPRTCGCCVMRFLPSDMRYVYVLDHRHPGA